MGMRGLTVFAKLIGLVMLVYAAHADVIMTICAAVGISLLLAEVTVTDDTTKKTAKKKVVRKKLQQ